MDKLKEAVAAAGQELMDEWGWSLDAWDDSPILETRFAKVVLKHLSKFGNNETIRLARIAALRAELAELEKTTNEKPDLV